MGKQPYIKFYIGDYIKDTRVLPLNIKGGWVDLILAMWDNEPRGEIYGCIEDFARIMNCSPDEANLVIQTLKQKKIFDYRPGDGCFFTIVSRKQKKMDKLSKTRQYVGKSGGNPTLLNQNSNHLDNQTDKQNPEHEYEYIKDRKEGLGEREGKWNCRPGLDELELPLPEIKSGAVIELFQFSKGVVIRHDQVLKLWGVFKKQNFTGVKFYNSPDETYSHFINWSKNQTVNGTHQQPSPVSRKSAGAAALLKDLKDDIADTARRKGNTGT